MAKKAIYKSFELSAVVMSLDKRIVEMQEENRMLRGKNFELRMEIDTAKEDFHAQEMILEGEIERLEKLLARATEFESPRTTARKNEKRVKA